MLKLKIIPLTLDETVFENMAQQGLNTIDCTVFKLREFEMRESLCDVPPSPGQREFISVKKISTSP